MICTRWTPRATATLANIGGSSRQGSSRHLLRSCLDADSRPGRGLRTNRGGDGDVILDSPSREAPQPLNSAQQTSGTGQAPNPQPRRRTWSPVASATNTAGLDRRLRNRANASEGHGRSWVDRRNRGGSEMEDESPDISGQEWPQLQRRERSGTHGDGQTKNYGAEVPKNPFYRRQNVQNPRGTTESSFVMLIIDGLSPNLNATDFYRITPNDLSHWQSVIKKVQQQRKVDTLEPLGRYWVTFSTGQAASSYRNRLVRLHKLNNFKLRSASGLWESSVPSSMTISLASPSAAAAAAAAAETGNAVTSDTPSTESLVDLVNTFTIAPSSQALLPIQRRKVSLLRPWANHLAELVENLGYGERPWTLMVDIYPPTLTAQELHQFIRRDGLNRGLRWQVSMPQHLKSGNSERESARANARRASLEGEMSEQDGETDKRQSPFFWRTDSETLEKLKGRFIFACADETEARRFQQSWNSRTLTTTKPQPARYIVHASIINW